MLRNLAAAIAIATLVVVAGAPAAPKVRGDGRFGEQRVLVIRSTWGPEPYSEAEVREVVFGATSDYIREASYGQAWLTGDVTPWLRTFSSALTCTATLPEAAPREAAARAGYNLSAYSRFVVVTPLPPGMCFGAGLEAGDGVWLFGYLDRRVLAHELGHTFGLDHAFSWDCRSGTCRSIEYGDPYDEMGHGLGHFNALEKVRIGWLRDTDVTRVRANGDYVVDQLELPTHLSRALVVRTAKTEYWFDHREPVGRDAFVRGSATSEGLLVHVQPSDPLAGTSPYPNPNTILLDPLGRGRDALVRGDVFRVAGAFELTVLAHERTTVRARFRWTDAQRPTMPRLTAPGRQVAAGRRVRVAWRAARDGGSGVDGYEVRADGRIRARISADAYVDTGGATVAPLARGRHAVAVVAVDRAGNRSRSATRRFVVGRRPR